MREVLALAIQSEEEDGRIYADLAKRIGSDFPDTARSLLAMHDEEDGHQGGGNGCRIGCASTTSLADRPHAGNLLSHDT